MTTSAEAMKEMAIEIMNTNFEMDFSDLSALFQYQGFDILACWKKLKALKIWKPHVGVILAFYVKRGTNSNAKKLSTGGKEKITAAMRAIGCKEKAIASNDLSISRIVCMFPSQVASLMLQHEIVPRKTLHGLPDYLCFPQAAAIIPETSSMWALFLSWSVEFDILVNANKTEADHKPNAERAKGYASLMAKNSVFDAKQKQRIISDLAQAAQNTVASSALAADAASA